MYLLLKEASHLNDISGIISYRAYFPQKPFDVHQEKFRRAFVFAVGDRAAGRYWWAVFVLCSHFWETPWVVSKMISCVFRDDGRLMTSQPQWGCTSNGPKLYASPAIFVCFSSPASRRCVHVSTCAAFPGRSKALNVNPAFTSRTSLRR